MDIKLVAVGIVIVIFLGWVAYGYFSIRGIEEPEYSVIEKREGYEVRLYAPYVIAAAEVEGNFQESIEKGFTIVAGYIFGGNTAKSKIAMTAPVQETKAVKIAMTAPVLETSAGTDLRRISFVMPKEYTMENLPTPDDSRVQLLQIPERKVAVLRFSWSSDAQTVAKKKIEFSERLKNDGFTQLGEPEAAFYNPPWTPPFMLRSEILIPIE